MMEMGIVRRAGLLGLIAVAATGAGWALLPEALPFFRSPPADTGSARAPPAAAIAAIANPPPAPQAPVQRAPEPPRFDVARVGARGMLVTAGRAAPGAEVILLEGARELGRARADARGEWVILPGEPLAPGARELALQARGPGQDPVPGRETVLLVVPEQPVAMAENSAVRGRGLGGLPAAGEAAQSGALAVLLPPVSSGGTGPRVLQGAPPAEAAGRQGLGLDVVDYDDSGAMRFAGSAAPGATVRLYVEQTHVGDAVADASGRWQLTPREQPSLGRHTLRLDQLAASGTVAARIEVPFQRDHMPEALVQNGRVVVQPGYSLWRIARAAYGHGVRYTVIYQANREQIRDPELIYPGQVFTVPEAVPQAESSRSR